MEQDQDRSLVPQSSHELTVPQVGQNRILVEMIETTLATAREIALANVDLDQLVREGKRLNSGSGMKPENIQAFQLFHQAATAGHSEAQFLVCKCYDFGRGVEADKAQYLSWLRKSAESGFAAAQSKLGIITKDPVEAAVWFRRAAIQGDAFAQYQLGIRYLNGENMTWSELETRYRQGEGVEMNDEEAVKWLLLAANQGKARAQYRLGICYATGQGVHQNDQEAVKWWRKSAVQWLQDGSFQLGMCYAHARGVPRDLIEGYKWLRLEVELRRRIRGANDAVSKTEKEAFAEAIALEALMSPSEIEAAFALLLRQE